MDRKGVGMESGSLHLPLLSLCFFSKNVPLSVWPALTLVCLSEDDCVERTTVMTEGASDNCTTVYGRAHEEAAASGMERPGFKSALPLNSCCDLRHVLTALGLRGYNTSRVL